MSSKPSPDRTILHSFAYPVYQLKAVGSNILLAAGGGGLSKTGVPNRLDVVQLHRPAYAPLNCDAQEALIPSDTTIIGGTSTKQEAIMHMTITSNSSGAAAVLALEGSTCQEYFLHSNDLEPSFVAESMPIEQESAISSSGVGHRNTPSFSSTSSSEDARPNGVSTTVKKRSKGEVEKPVKKIAADSSGEDQPPWTCQVMRSVSVAPTPALMERRRLDSCSSTGSITNASLNDDELTCITSGGPGNSWCAVGTVHGGVALIDRLMMSAADERPSLAGPALPCSPTTPSYAFTFDEEGEETVFPLQPFCTLPDVSGGRCAQVCDVSFSATAYTPLDVQHREKSSANGTVPVTPLLATISGRPMGSLLCIWRLPVSVLDGRQNSKKEAEEAPIPALHAEVKMENAPIPTDRKAASARHKRPENGTRFRHCKFLHWIHQTHPPTPSAVDSGLFTFLVTTEQPISPTGRSICHLSVWLVPMQTAAIGAKHQKVQPPVLGLERFASKPLPPGDIPACIAVHPSKSRGLVALGTMDGSVDVFMISLKEKSLVHVYSMPKAHPIFVTSLTFLPPREKPLTPVEVSSKQLLPPHYELVSSSADRVIRWHRGPSMQRVAAIGAGIEPRSPLRPSFTTVMSILLILFLPLLLAPLEALLR